jgi:hypothetical protein
MSERVKQVLNLFNHFITDREYEIALNNGISKRRVDHRVRVLYWDKKRAITQPVKHIKRGYITIEIRKKAADNGISYSLLRKRISNGMSLDEAVNTPLADKRNNLENAHKNNKKYPDFVYKCLDENEISRSTFYKRVKHGWNIVDACTKPIMTAEEKSILTSERNKTSYWKKDNKLIYKVR